jgi:hypothetical protein
LPQARCGCLGGTQQRSRLLQVKPEPRNPNPETRLTQGWVVLMMMMMGIYFYSNESNKQHSLQQCKQIS